MMMGHGYPATGYFLEHGGTPTLGVDVVTSTGGDMFSQMKFALQAERSRANEQLLQQGEMPGELNLQSSQVLRFATSAGAQALGLEQKVGTLTPGKEADLIMIRTTDLNMFPVHDPIGAVVQFANPSNVDTVFVAGRLVKREGKLLNVDLDAIRHTAMQSKDYLLIPIQDVGRGENCFFVIVFSYNLYLIYEMKGRIMLCGSFTCLHIVESDRIR